MSLGIPSVPHLFHWPSGLLTYFLSILCSHHNMAFIVMIITLVIPVTLNNPVCVCSDVSVWGFRPSGSYSLHPTLRRYQHPNHWGIYIYISYHIITVIIMLLSLPTMNNPGNLNNPDNPNNRLTCGCSWPWFVLMKCMWFILNVMWERCLHILISIIIAGSCISYHGFNRV